jgi:hypothetical protein
MKKLTPKQREETVTKGFLYEQNFVTKEYLDKKLEPYVTKEYLDKKLKEQSAEFRQHIDTLIEHQLDQIQIFMEQMDKRYVLRREWNVLK